jgi:vacuolar protein sorting-associated protein 26
VTLKKPGTKLEHQGIKIELIGELPKKIFPIQLFLNPPLVSRLSGQIELFYDRGNHHEFITQLKELARHGDLIKNTSYPFEFPNVEKPYEVYTGSNVRLR